MALWASWDVVLGRCLGLGRREVGAKVKLGAICRVSLIVSLTENQLKSIKLLLSGMPQNEVAQRLGVTPRTLQRWAKNPEYKAGLGDSATQATEAIHTELEVVEEFDFFAERKALRKAECELLNIAQNAIMKEVKAGNLRAIAILLKISERRSRLLALDVANYPFLNALEILIEDKIASPEQAAVVSEGIRGMWEKLRAARADL